MRKHMQIISSTSFLCAVGLASSATAAVSLPPPTFIDTWNYTNLAAPFEKPMVGTATDAGYIVKITTNNANGLWGIGEEAGFVYKVLQGDSAVEGKFQEILGNGELRQGGLMVRSSLTNYRSSYVDIRLVGNNLVGDFRYTDNGTVKSETLSLAPSVQRGDRFALTCKKVAGSTSNEYDVTVSADRNSSAFFAPRTYRIQSGGLLYAGVYAADYNSDDQTGSFSMKDVMAYNAISGTLGVGNENATIAEPDGTYEYAIASQHIAAIPQGSMTLVNPNVVATLTPGTTRTLTIKDSRTTSSDTTLESITNLTAELALKAGAAGKAFNAITWSADFTSSLKTQLNYSYKQTKSTSFTQTLDTTSTVTFSDAKAQQGYNNLVIWTGLAYLPGQTVLVKYKIESQKYYISWWHKLWNMPSYRSVRTAVAGYKFMQTQFPIMVQVAEYYMVGLAKQLPPSGTSFTINASEITTWKQ